MKNPFLKDDLNIEDIRGDQYAFMPPISNVLRVEALGYFLVASGLYHWAGFSWIQFFIWFLLPDLSMLVYVFASARAGMWAYNVAHSSIGAALVSVYAVVFNDKLCQQIALIWWAHIGFDRALGYGLKYPMGFRVTHMGLIQGRSRKS